MQPYTDSPLARWMARASIGIAWRVGHVTGDQGKRSLRVSEPRAWPPVLLGPGRPAWCSSTPASVEGACRTTGQTGNAAFPRGATPGGGLAETCRCACEARRPSGNGGRRARPRISRPRPADAAVALGTGPVSKFPRLPRLGFPSAATTVVAEHVARRPGRRSASGESQCAVTQDIDNQTRGQHAVGRVAPPVGRGSGSRNHRPSPRRLAISPGGQRYSSRSAAAP